MKLAGLVMVVGGLLATVLLTVFQSNHGTFNAAYWHWVAVLVGAVVSGIVTHGVGERGVWERWAAQKRGFDVSQERKGESIYPR